MLLKSSNKLLIGFLALLGITLALGAGVEVLAKPAGLKTQTFKQSSLADVNSSAFLFDSNYTSPTLTTEEKMNVLGFKWQGDKNARFWIQTSRDENWSDWLRVPQMEGLAGKSDEYNYSDLIFFPDTKSFRYRYESAEEITGVEAITLNPSAGRNVLGFLRALIPGAKAELTVIPRTEWGADETISTWEPEYAEPVKFIIHHTAGSDGSVEPEGSLRAIQYWHAVVMGWGDIGYNYIIDASGKVYEGRKGGDGAIGAHAYRNSTCNEQRFGGSDTGIDFNRGTIGIAVMGNYEDNALPESLLEPIANLIAEKSKVFGIEPNGASDFQDLINLPNISSHQDVDCTLCPGKNLYASLPQIRELAQNLYQAGGGVQPIVSARLTNTSISQFELKAGATTTLWADFVNTGNTTWHSYGSPPVLSTASPASVLKADSWVSSATVARLTTPNVAPGETGRFEFTVAAPNDRLEASEVFYLAYNDLPLAESGFEIKVQVTGLERAAKLVSADVKKASFLGARLKTVLKYENLGTKTWTPADTFLNIYDLGDKISRYRDKSWNDDSGKIALKEASVPAGGTGTFEFYEISPNQTGLYRQIFRLFNENRDIINSSASLISRVDSLFRAELVSTDLPLAVKAGWQPTVTLKFKNTGGATWDKNLRLQIFDQGLKTSPFYSSTWSTASGNIRLKETSVKPGEIGTFIFKLKSPKQVGLFRHVFRLKSQSYPYSIEGGEVTRLTRVDRVI
ncbi:MAG: N-acetylmuramoyl-L-alanine amidase [Patescibacteria group bacterium]|nr:N-acetylmuramoyl-L-alanine amidase [Patescibacteria group bacterium]